MLFDGRNAGAMRPEAAADFDFTRRRTGFDAKSHGRKSHHYPFDQRLAGAAEGLNAAMHHDPADRLADLNAHCAVRVGDHAIELGKVHCACVDVETASPETKGFDRSVDSQLIDDPEVYKPDAARTVRREFLIGDPAIDDTPIVQYHVIHAIGHNRAVIPNHVNMGAVDREDSPGDLVRRSGGNLAVAVHRLGVQSSYEKTAPLVTVTAHEDAAP